MEKSKMKPLSERERNAEIKKLSNQILKLLRKGEFVYLEHTGKAKGPGQTLRARGA
jgi:hypothetical protein